MIDTEYSLNMMGMEKQREIEKACRNAWKYSAGCKWFRIRKVWL
jgi:hypothetical protein